MGHACRPFVVHTRETRGHTTTGRERRPAPDIPAHMPTARGGMVQAAGDACVVRVSDMRPEAGGGRRHMRFFSRPNFTFSLKKKKKGWTIGPIHFKPVCHAASRRPIPYIMTIGLSSLRLGQAVLAPRPVPLERHGTWEMWLCPTHMTGMVYEVRSRSGFTCIHEIVIGPHQQYLTHISPLWYNGH